MRWMAPIEASVNYLNNKDEVIDCGEPIIVSPGLKGILQGKLGAYEAECTKDDIGGILTVIRVAEDVKRGFFGLGGRFGPKIRTVIRHSQSRKIELRGKYGYDCVNIKHNPPKSPKGLV
jgi:hypothetical protein